MILLIAIILDHTLEPSKDLHKRLVARLVEQEIVKNFEFLSFNYDILIDNALVAQEPIVDLDYCLEFTNFEKTGPGQWHRPRPEKAVRLLKLHGSLNWLYCPTCRAITLTPKEKSVCKLVTDPRCVHLFMWHFVRPDNYSTELLQGALQSLLAGGLECSRADAVKV